MPISTYQSACTPHHVKGRAFVFFKFTFLDNTAKEHKHWTAYELCTFFFGRACFFLLHLISERLIISSEILLERRSALKSCRPSPEAVLL